MNISSFGGDSSLQKISEVMEENIIKRPNFKYLGYFKAYIISV